MSAKKITVALLRKHGACAEQVRLFRKHFPKGVIPTQKLARKFAVVFDFGWAANLLSAPARADCERVKASAWTEYERARASVFVRAWRADK